MKPPRCLISNSWFHHELSRETKPMIGEKDLWGWLSEGEGIGRPYIERVPICRHRARQEQ